MRRYIIEDVRQVPPFNEPASELTVVKVPLKIHHENLFAELFGDRCELGNTFRDVDGKMSTEAIRSVGPGEAVLYRDSLWFDIEFLWEYDSEAGRYRRSADGQVHADANTMQQITADNVVVIYAGHYFSDIIESVWQDSVSYSIQITVWPEGDVVLLRDGQRYDGRWVRAVREDLISLQTTDGEPLYLKPGNTWFQLVQLPEQMNPTEEWVQIQ